MPKPTAADHDPGVKVTVQGIPVHYRDEGEGRPVVMLHGRPSDHRLMHHHLEPIFAARAGWRRLYPDLPGMGTTPPADWIETQDDMLEVVLGFIDSVIPGQQFSLIGASYGGYLARGVVHRRSADIDGLLLWAPAVTLERDNRTTPAHQVFRQDPAALASLEPDEQNWLQVAVVQTPETLAEFRAAAKPGFPLADEAFLERLEEHDSFSFDVTDLAGPLTVPTLIVAGRQDSIVGYAEAVDLLEAFPRATLAVLDRAGHALAGEQRPLFRALVNDWLDRVEEHADGD
jgi:pimeloyl-ACP methyl ester carboxylesterase